MIADRSTIVPANVLQYAVAMGDGATLDEVEARCDNHAPFLISHFYEDRTAFDWEPTIFFKWLVERHPVSNNLRHTEEAEANGYRTSIWRCRRLGR